MLEKFQNEDTQRKIERAEKKRLQQLEKDAAEKQARAEVARYFLPENVLCEARTPLFAA